MLQITIIRGHLPTSPTLFSHQNHFISNCELKTTHHELVREYSGIRDFQTGLLIFQYGQTFDHVFDTLTLTKILIYIYEISLGG